MAETVKKRQRIYISLPISDRDEQKQRTRAAELANRIRCRGWEPVNPFEIGDALAQDCKENGEDAPKWRDFMAEDIYALLDCDGILLDIDAKNSYGCSIETAVAQVMATRGKFRIYHTKEQWTDVKNRYTI